jgi:LysM repeat protein
MKHHRPSRWLAPLALLAAVAAVLFVVSGTTSDGGGGGDEPTTEERREAQGGTGRTGEGAGTGPSTSTTKRRRTYTVKPGDTLATISERTGVPVEELQELNPRLDPNSLSVGQKIKLER